MTPDDYSKIANGVYSVDPLWKPPHLTKGQVFPRDGKPQFYVDDLVTDPVTGFQGMSVIPVLSNPPLVLDYSHVIVAFAGTNPEHRADATADLQTVIGGETGFGTQAAEAAAFAQKVSKTHPGATITTTGHSLGGNLALRVAAENGWRSTTFNAPDPWVSLSPAAQKWLKGQMAAGKNPLTNFVNEFDLVGNSLGNGTGAASFVKGRPGQPFLDNHNVPPGITFDPVTGAVVGAGVAGRTIEEVIKNAVEGFSPGMGEALAPMLAGMVQALRNPGVGAFVGKQLSQLVVTVDTVAAASLAASIAGTEVALQAIKTVNGALIDGMQTGLDNARNGAHILPYITRADIENCVERHRLQVHQNIDKEAVARVDRLVDDHITIVNKLADGILTTVMHTAAQDAQWALIYNGR